jgi:Sugar kinases, ribokinase family
MLTSKKIVCIGSVTADVLITPVDALPAPGTIKNIDSASLHVGGCAANSAMDLAKMGLPVKVIFKLGKDAFSEFVTKAIADTGIDTGGISYDESVATTTSIGCIASNGERCFLYSPGSTAVFGSDDINRSYIDDCDIVFIAGTNIISKFDGKECAEFLKEMQEKGNFTALDTAWDFEDVWLNKVKDSIKYLDLFMPSIDEAAKITGLDDHKKMADMFFKLGAKSVIIKLGKKGAYICENFNTRYISESIPVKKVKDTTGAGDAFCAGFLAGLALGWNYKKSARLANAAGAYCVMEIGACTGLKPIEEIINFMEEQ